MITTFNIKYLALFLLAGCLFACSDDTERVSSADNGKMVSLSVRVPSTAEPSTYALTATDENTVGNIAVLLFDAAGYAGGPYYGSNITDDPGDNSIKHFNVKIPEGTYTDVVVLANAVPAMSSAVLNSINIGDTKVSVLNKIILNNSGKWNTAPGSAGYIPIPMWGEIAGLTVGSTPPAPRTVTMLRMIAKIDVDLSTTARGKFNLSSVRLYNYNNQGQIAPDAANWNSASNLATAPSVPATASKPANPETAPHIYDGAAITQVTGRGVSCLNEIYTFEAEAGTDAALLTNTCLVIGGKYDTDANDTYYRIDFGNKVGNTMTYLDLLRNHNYKVAVADVTGPGLSTPGEAFRSRTVNVEASVIPWSDGRFTEFDVNDQYLIGVSQGEFTFSRDSRGNTDSDNTLIVTTNNPGGWAITKIVDAADAPAGWLTCSSMNGTGNYPTGDNIKLNMGPNAGTPRTAFVHMTAGRLNYIVKVTQDDLGRLDIQLRDAADAPVTGLTFVAAADVQPAAQTFKLRWAPASAPITFTNTVVAGSNAFVFDTGAGLDNIPAAGNYTDPTGTKVFTIQPTAITTADLNGDPFYERNSLVTYTVNDGVGTANKTLNLRQWAPNLVTDAGNYYMLNGTTYTLHVRSNAAWRIQSVTESTPGLLNLAGTDDLIAGTTGGINTTTGSAVTFRVANNVSLNGTVTVVFESTDPAAPFANKTVVLNMMGQFYPPMHSGWAGSNIYWDAALGHLTFDDVNVKTHQYYQGVYFQWGSLWGIDPSGAPGSAWATNKTVYRLDAAGNHVPVTTSNTWNSFPRVNNASITSSPPSGKTARYRAYLYEIHNPATGVGDICRLLTEKGWAPGSPAKKWRMPTSQEFEAAANYTRYGTWATVPSNNAAGQFTVGPGYTKTGTGTPAFPASGYRANSSGSLGGVGSYGYYWSGSPHGTNGYFLGFYGGTVGPYSNYGNRAYGFTVRCVAE